MRWNAASKSPHEDISQNLEVLRNRSRDLYAGGGPLGRGAIDRVVLNALGSGLRLNVRIDNNALGMTWEQSRDWKAQTENEFDYWASSKNCDYCGMLNFYELQILAFKSLLLDGDCLVLLPKRAAKNFPYDTKILLVEGERLQTPPIKPAGVMIDEGVELDKYGVPCAYWIANRNPNAELSNQPGIKYERVLRSDVIHLMNPERISQRRGVPFLSPVIEQLRQLSRYTDAELMAAVVSGMYAIFFEHEKRDGDAIGAEEYATEGAGMGGISGELESLTQQNLYGGIMDLPEGVKPVGLSPSRPNNNFSGFVESLVHQIGGSLGIPSELMFLQFTASYSASRGALLEAWKLFKYWRAWFSENFCQPVYEAWLNEAVKLGRIDAPGFGIDDYHAKLYTWAEWTGPSQGQLNPVQEVQASILKVENGFSTYQRETAELTGGDYELNSQQLERERANKGE